MSNVRIFTRVLKRSRTIGIYDNINIFSFSRYDGHRCASSCNFIKLIECKSQRFRVKQKNQKNALICKIRRRVKPGYDVVIRLIVV